MIGMALTILCGILVIFFAIAFLDWCLRLAIAHTATKYLPEGEREITLKELMNKDW